MQVIKWCHFSCHFVLRPFCRTFFIWMVSLYLGWEQFSWVQVIGFAVMVTGTFYFNGVLKWPFVKEEDSDEATERTPLLQES